MKIYSDIEQGSTDWYAIRAGIPTASCFDKIVTPTGKLSTQSRKYAFQLISERVLKIPAQSLQNLEWIERGKDLEADAVKFYEFQNDVTTELVCFVTTNDGKIGASPDRLVGSNGLLEAKCPAPATHVGYLVEGFGSDYFNQAQGQLLVCEREWCDRLSYYPSMPPVSQRTYRDETRIALLRDALAQFNDELYAMIETIKSKGLVMPKDEIATPHEAYYEDNLNYLYAG